MSAAVHGLRRGFLPGPGALRLCGLRFGYLALLAAPAWWFSRSAVTDGPGRSSELAAQLGDMGLAAMLESVRAAAPGISVGAVCVVLGLGLDLILTGGALELCGPGGPPARGMWRALRSGGARHFWPLLRVRIAASAAALVGCLCLALIGLGAAAAQSSPAPLLGALPPTLLAMSVWLALVGAGSHWCRVVVVADERRFVRRVVPIVARLWWRQPLRGPLFHALAIALVVAGGGAILARWRGSDPVGSGELLPWVLAWALVTWVHAWVWCGFQRAGRLIWAAERFADLRATPDSGWRRARRGAIPAPSRPGFVAVPRSPGESPRR